ncbi:hypothetical protein [Andreprevotia sp. IGB-42]|uniref:hypothetical protein n=1 Tax=Andreprevotia sp. IGB-42 TaxID=2497473 RepID=UPI00135C2959|nr:hypothetical protein [Andreprevotia sp. IGB-42]
MIIEADPAAAGITELLQLQDMRLRDLQPTVLARAMHDGMPKCMLQVLHPAREIGLPGSFRHVAGQLLLGSGEVFNISHLALQG